MLSDNSKGDIGWKKWLVAGWAFMECLLFGGLLYGWGSLMFVLKDEGIYADLCPKEEISLSLNASNSSVTYNPEPGFNESVFVVTLTNLSSTISLNTNDSTVEEVKKQERCVPQDEKMALCFTIASAIFCAGCAVMGHINYMFGTRATRVIAL